MYIYIYIYTCVTQFRLEWFDAGVGIHGPRWESPLGLELIELRPA